MAIDLARTGGGVFVPRLFYRRSLLMACGVWMAAWKGRWHPATSWPKRERAARQDRTTGTPGIKRPQSVELKTGLSGPPRPPTPEVRSSGVPCKHLSPQHTRRSRNAPSAEFLWKDTAVTVSRWAVEEENNRPTQGSETGVLHGFSAQC